MTRGRVPVILGTALALLGAAGCSSAPPEPEQTAQALADGLAEGDLADVPIADGASQAQQDLLRITEGLGVAGVDVDVVDAVAGQPGADQARATLEFVWDLDGPGGAPAEWTYQSQARLRLTEADEPAWEVVWDPTIVHPDLEPGTGLGVERTQPPRAAILGRDSVPLVVERPVERIGIDKVRLAQADPEASARALAALVGVDADGYTEAVLAAGPQAFVQAIVLREQDADPLRDSVAAIPGGRLVAASLPLAPTREFARALLGTVGEATAEIVEESGGDIAAGDLVGLSGLQQAYDAQLRGEPGFTVQRTVLDSSDPDATGGSSEPPEARTLVTLPPTPGEPLRITLDADIQQVADDVLGEVVPASAVVALRPSSGELLAVASGPGSDEYSTATLGRYAPGSVFKIATSLAMLRAGLSPSSPLPCTDSITVDGRVFVNYSDFPSDALGEIALGTAFAQSCNTAFLSQSDIIGASDLAAAAQSLGISEEVDIGVEAALGSVGDPVTVVEEAAGLIGQGTVLLSPLGAATMVASTAGRTVVPRLVVRDTDEASPPQASASPVGPEESAALLAMMRQAVADGTAAVLASVPGAPVAAKTGTAEYGTETPPATHGWMVAVQDDLAVAVFVADAESGSATAGPLLAEFLSRVSTSGSQ